MDGFSQVLLDQYGGLIDEQGKQYLRFIRDSAGDFGRQIAGLVELLRLGTTELRPSRVDLSATAEGVIERLRATDEATVARVREYERRHKGRTGVIEATERQTAGSRS
jgi:hypothetical protein